MGEIFIELAKASIMLALGMDSSFDLAKARESYPVLNQNGAVFITINKDNKLRGCIGSLEAYRPLYKDIIANAKSSAFSDPRFSKLTLDEFKDIKIEVSLLSTPKVVEYKDILDLKSKITPKKDGVVLTFGKHRATYLPSVWDSFNSFDDFFGSLCQKASLKSNCLNQHPTIKLYQATKYEEK